MESTLINEVASTTSINPNININSDFDLDAIYGEAVDHLSSLTTESVIPTSATGPDEVALLKGFSHRVRPYVDPSRRQVVNKSATHRVTDPETKKAVVVTCTADKHGHGCPICDELRLVGNSKATHHWNPRVITRMYATIFESDPKQASAWKGVPVIISGPESLYDEVQRVIADIRKSEEAGHYFGIWTEPTADVPCLVIRYSKDGELTVGYHWIKESMQPLPEGEDWKPLAKLQEVNPPTPEQVKVFQAAIQAAAYGKGKRGPAALDD